MNIQLKKLSLRNFKKIREFNVAFDNQITNIHGANEAGKTTLFDAFLWLFFDKDSTDRKTFEIKTLDENNKAINKLEHEVTGEIDVDGTDIVLRKVFKEKWVKKRGETTSEFAGHDTAYYWNEVPCQKKEFEQKVAGLFNEKLFKLITNTIYFNSLDWQERRKVLIDMAGKISTSDVLNRLNRTGNVDIDISELEKALTAKKTVEEFKREISAKKKKIKDDLLLVPARIDEAKRLLPEDTDYEEIEFTIKTLSNDYDLVDSMITDRSKSQKQAQDRVINLMQQKQNLSRLLMDIEFSERNKVQERKMIRDRNIIEKRTVLRGAEDDILKLQKEYSQVSAKLKDMELARDGARERWNIENEKILEFKDDEFCCPTCKREYEPHLINEKKVEVQANFNTDKSNKLAAITKQGQEYAVEIKELQAKLGNIEAAGKEKRVYADSLKKTIATYEEENVRLSASDESEFEKAISENVQYQQYKTEREELSIIIETPADDVEDNSALIQRKKELQSNLDTLKQKLATKGQREKQLKRIAELEEQEGTWNQELADLEATEFSILSFEKASMDLLEQRINGKFKLVRFKLFEQQINGGETPTCITLVKGVPFPDVNTAGKIQAGLDIINALSEHYNIYGPVWVDNRESVTNLPETNSQLINLIVSPEHKKLTVGKKEGAALELFS